MVFLFIAHGDHRKRSCPAPVLGKAITSRNDFSHWRIINTLSIPKAIPP
ncbi:MAG: hypothetical protein WCL18_05400 [bacterium]